MGRRSREWADFQRMHQAEKHGRAVGRVGDAPGWGVAGTSRTAPLFGPGGMLSVDPAAPEAVGVPSWGVSTGVDSADVPSRELLRESAKREAERVLAAAGDPLGDTGSTFTVHGAEITIFAGLDDVAEVVGGEAFPDSNPFVGPSGISCFEFEGSTRAFERRFSAPCGVTLLDGPRVGTGYVRVVLRGEFFEVYGVTPFARLLATFEERCWRWHLTRVDNAFDGVAFGPRKLARALDRGCVRSRARRKRAVGGTLTLPLGPDGDEPRGETCTWGDRGSADYLRLYNRRGFNRLEHECRGDRARVLGMQFVHRPIAEWSLLALANLRDFVDLVRLGPGENVTRAKLLPWWAEFVGSVPRCRVNLSAAASIRERADEAGAAVLKMWRGIARRVAMVRELTTPAVFSELVGSAAGLLRGSERLALESMRAALDQVDETFSGVDAMIAEAFKIAPPVLVWHRRKVVEVEAWGRAARAAASGAGPEAPDDAARGGPCP